MKNLKAIAALAAVLGIATTHQALACSGFIGCAIGGDVGDTLDNWNAQSGHVFEQEVGTALNAYVPGSGSVYTGYLTLQNPGYFMPQDNSQPQFSDPDDGVPAVR